MRRLLARIAQFLNLPGRKLALLGAAGMLLVATPMAQLWLQHGAELAEMVDARRSLRPMQLAVATHRALIQHRPVAAAVLRGVAEEEPARRQRQATVDQLLASLASALDERRHHRALGEAHSMQDAWHLLVRGILERRLLPSASDAAHELLVEQTVLIVDLESMVIGIGARMALPHEWLLAAAQAPRLDAALAQWATAQERRQPEEQESAGLRVQQRAREALGRLAALVEERPDPEYGRALLALQAALRDLAAGTRPATGPVREAERASAQWQSLLHSRLEQRVAREIIAFQDQREQLAGLALVWLGAWLLAMAQLLRLARRTLPDPGDASTAAAQAAPAHSHQTARELIRRLRGVAGDGAQQAPHRHDEGQ